MFDMEETDDFFVCNCRGPEPELKLLLDFLLQKKIHLKSITLAFPHNDNYNSVADLATSMV